MNKLRYLYYAIVFEEVPDEITLAIGVSGCTHRCAGCHSPELREDGGRILIDDIDSIIDKWNDVVTCVCLMGDGAGKDSDILDIVCKIKDRGKKPALYTGNDDLEDWMLNFSYVKTGRYIEDLGPLRSKTTNQKMFRVDNGNIECITHMYWRDKF